MLELDYFLFQLINQSGQNSIFDLVMPLLRDKYFWIPLYLFITTFLLINFKKTGLYIVLGMVVTIGLADNVSSQLIKKTVQRVRPCNDVQVKKEVRLLVRCGGGYSFTSSHATNHFALAVFLIGTLGKLFRWIKLPLLLWAAAVSYAQVYVGVHYPFDVLSGAILGSLIGVLCVNVAFKFLKLET